MIGTFLGKGDGMTDLRLRAMVMFLICLGWALAASSAGAAEQTNARVTLLEGSARVFSAERPKSAPLKKGDHLTKGEEVKVGERSRLEIRFPEGSVMRLSENTAVTIGDVLYRNKNGDKTISISLAIGRIWAKVRRFATANSRVEVRTSNAVAGVRGTVYRVNAEEDRSAVIRVYDGTVAVEGIPRGRSDRLPSPPVEVPGPHVVPPPYHEVTREEWHVIVGSFQQVTVTPDGRPSEPSDFNPGDDRDEWVRWNQKHDNNVGF